MGPAAPLVMVTHTPTRHGLYELIAVPAGSGLARDPHGEMPREHENALAAKGRSPVLGDQQVLS